jgi:hypothetical protein
VGRVFNSAAGTLAVINSEVIMRFIVIYAHHAVKLTET